MRRPRCAGHRPDRVASKSDIRRYDKLREYGCVCCRVEGLPVGPVDIHHLVDKGNRELSGGNAASIGLCGWHHRGLVPAGHTIASATLAFGPSLRHTSRLFHKIYGNERAMLARVDAWIQPDTVNSDPLQTNGNADNSADPACLLANPITLRIQQ
jgi:hypothetical protein